MKARDCRRERENIGNKLPVVSLILAQERVLDGDCCREPHPLTKATPSLQCSTVTRRAKAGRSRFDTSNELRVERRNRKVV